MSGDCGHESNLRAVMDVAALASSHNVLFKIVGDEKCIIGEGGDRLRSMSNVEIVHCSDVIRMSESPKSTLRRKTTISTCLNLVKDGHAQACLSSGNTGALMMLAHVILKPIAGIDRVAICAAVPNRKSCTYFLDLGANANCRSDHLLQFGIMASILFQVQEKKSRPSVALLNIGSEQFKGNSQVKETASLFEQSNALNYVGFVEGHNLFDGSVDVVVTDGFTGNVALKASEGVIGFIRDKTRFKTDNWLHNLLLLPALPFLMHISGQIDPRRYNGASFLGLNGNVLKSHGNADSSSFKYSLMKCVSQARANLSQEIAAKFGLTPAASARANGAALTPALAAAAKTGGHVSP
ncbi:MAG: phosphate acyltransferase PlsX [Gammaproteobacteria bacterium]|nr:phosphate acyltransferase PlsX [Gammaproteobacteria bacterium]